MMSHEWHPSDRIGPTTGSIPRVVVNDDPTRRVPRRRPPPSYEEQELASIRRTITFLAVVVTLIAMTLMVEAVILLDWLMTSRSSLGR